MKILVATYQYRKVGPYIIFLYGYPAPAPNPSPAADPAPVHVTWKIKEK